MKKSWAVLLVAGLVAAAAVPIYKWVDDAGNVHYSDQPPPKEFTGEALEFLPAPTQQETQQARERLERLRAELAASRDRRAAAQEQERLARELEDAERVERLQLCVLARQNLDTLETRTPVYYIDEHGERAFLDDEQRAAAIQGLRTEIETYCD